MKDRHLYRKEGDMHTLKDKVAIVTGSSRGMGRAIAVCFGREGCKVVVNYKNSRDRALETTGEIDRYGSECLVVRADVTKEEEVNNMMNETMRKFGKIDILVNNVGSYQRCGFLEMGLGDWEASVKSNLTSVFLCTRAALPFILKQANGRIINIASTSGITGGTSGVHYAAAKGGVIAFTKAVSGEFAPRGVTVNAIIPSKVETDMLYDSLKGKDPEDLLKKIPVGRFGKPEEIANIALFLASDSAGYITGETITASGGYR
jgi:3-oxoacyl-[acyl-carrier protein] reductase